VGATSAGTRFGVSPFWIWHDSSGFFSISRSVVQ
jgi:hypothetical protein